MMEVALEVDGLVKRFGDVSALDDVSLRVRAGSVFGLLGPNGAGKTTLVSIASGFLRADAGRVSVLGEDARSVRRRRGRFAVLPQDAALQPGTSVLDQLVLFDRLAGASAPEAREAARRALRAVRLEEAGSRVGRALSHGMQKRVAIAQALLGEPQVILLDEPTAGLDPENARAVRDLVRDMAGERTIVLSSHNLHEIQDLCDDVAILHRGRIAEAGSVATLTSQARVLRLTFAQPLPDAVRCVLAAIPGVERVCVDGSEVQTVLEAGADRDRIAKDVLALLLEHDLVPRTLGAGESLESRFLAITREAEGESGRVGPVESVEP